MRNWLRTICLLTLLINPQVLWAEDPSDVEVPKFWDMITNLPEDWTIFKDKAMDPKNLGAWAGVLGSTALFVAYDREMFDASKDWFEKDRWVNDMHWQGVNMGDGYFQFAVAGVFGAWGGLTGNKRALRTTSQIVEVILSTGALVQIIKHYSGRQSPFKSDDTRTGRWEPMPEQVKYYGDVQNYDAGPSGHLATFYATFIVIKENYPEQKWIPWVGYPLTFWVAEGLAGSGLHWWSDYPIGLALGHTFAYIVTDRNKKDTAAWGEEWSKPIVSVEPSKSGAPLMSFRWGW